MDYETKQEMRELELRMLNHLEANLKLMGNQSRQIMWILLGTVFLWISVVSFRFEFSNLKSRVSSLEQSLKAANDVRTEP